MTLFPPPLSLSLFTIIIIIVIITISLLCNICYLCLAGQLARVLVEHMAAAFEPAFVWPLEFHRTSDSIMRVYHSH